jgi:hypothetical protein
MTKYKWEIISMDCIPKEGQLINVISTIIWLRYAELNGIIVSKYGNMKCSKPNKTDFIAYSDLTFEQICQWLDAELNVSELDIELDAQIQNIINPTIITLPLPFKQ